MTPNARAEAEDKQHSIPWLNDAVFVLACALVIIVFAGTAKPGFRQRLVPDTKESYYNLLVQGFQAGQLNLKKDAPLALARLPHPYDPVLNAPYRRDLTDLSYYRGKLYLYFGVAPALVLLWPYAALTGHYLSDQDAVIVFFTIGFLFAAGLLRDLWRCCFPKTNITMLVMGILAFGAAIGSLEARSLWCDVYEVALTCSFAFTMIAVAALWGALRGAGRPVLWTLLASLACGMAIASRPSILYGAVMLVVPAFRAWHQFRNEAPERRIWPLLAAAIVPVTLIVMGLMFYNFLRFDSPFEFGSHYQLQGGFDPGTIHQFDPRYFWDNLHFYFWQPVQVSRYFPFLQSFVFPWPLPVENSGKYYGGILWLGLVAWMALALPLLWKAVRYEKLSRVRWFVGALVLLFLTCAVTLCCFYLSSTRYSLDFAPALILLGVIGCFVFDSLGGSPVWKRLARYGAYAVLLGSLALSLLSAIGAHADADYFIANSFIRTGQIPEAIINFQKAFALEPHSADIHAGLGSAYSLENRFAEAIAECETAFAIQPDFDEAAAAHNNLGYCFRTVGRIDEAIVQYEDVLKINPGFAEAYNALGTCFFQQGKMPDAIAQFRKTLALKPDFAEAHYNLASCFLQTGQVDAAVDEFQKAIALRPDHENYYNALAGALFQEGQIQPAIDQYQRALELKPDFAEARYNLGYCFLQSGQVDAAIAQFQKAIETRPVFALAYQRLGDAYHRKGMEPQAEAAWQKAAALGAHPQ